MDTSIFAQTIKTHFDMPAPKTISDTKESAFEFKCGIIKETVIADHNDPANSSGDKITNTWICKKLIPCKACKIRNS
jgi:hypothetical protein